MKSASEGIPWNHHTSNFPIIEMEFIRMNIFLQFSFSLKKPLCVCVCWSLKVCGRLTAISNPIPKIPNCSASLGLGKEKRLLLPIGLWKSCKEKEGPAQILKIHTFPRAKLFYFYSWFYFKIVIAVLDEIHLYLWQTPELDGCHPVKQLENTWDYLTKLKRFCINS